MSEISDSRCRRCGIETERDLSVVNIAAVCFAEIVLTSCK